MAARRLIRFGLARRIEVIGAEVLIEYAVGDHVVGGCEDGGGDGSDSLFCPAPGAQTVELSLEIAALFCGRRPTRTE